MHLPDTSRIVETFIMIPSDPDPHQFSLNNFNILRSDVSPLVRRLSDSGMTVSYSFLVHNHESGVPTSPQDPELYVHLRLEAAGGISPNEIIAALPERCVMSRPMPGPHPHTMEKVDATALKNQDIRYGWGLLAKASQWILDVVEANDEESEMSLHNIRMFAH